MSDLNDPRYYAQRERQSLDYAKRAQEPAIRRIHMELAERYRQLRRQSLRLVEVGG